MKAETISVHDTIGQLFLFLPWVGGTCKLKASVCSEAGARPMLAGATGCSGGPNNIWHCQRVACETPAPFCLAIAENTGVFGRTLSTSKTKAWKGRHRGIFPLSPLSGRDHKPSEWNTKKWNSMRALVNSVIAALNWCYGVKAADPRPARPNKCCAAGRLEQNCVPLSGFPCSAGKPWPGLIGEPHFWLGAP